MAGWRVCPHPANRRAWVMHAARSARHPPASHHSRTAFSKAPIPGPAAISVKSRPFNGNTGTAIAVNRSRNESPRPASQLAPNRTSFAVPAKARRRSSSDAPSPGTTAAFSPANNPASAPESRNRPATASPSTNPANRTTASAGTPDATIAANRPKSPASGNTTGKTPHSRINPKTSITRGPTSIRLISPQTRSTDSRPSPPTPALIAANASASAAPRP